MPENTDLPEVEMQLPDDDLNIDWTKVIVALITATVTLIGTVGTVYIRHTLQSEEPDRISVALESSREINQRLSDIKSMVGADRVVISQFHNGVKFASGASYEKISTTHEVTSPGIAPSQDKVRSIPITLFEDVLLSVRDSVYVVYDDIGIIPNSGVQALMKQGGVESVYFFRLNDIRGMYIGILQIEYVKEPKTFTDEEIAELRSAANAIGAYLSTQEGNINSR